MLYLALPLAISFFTFQQIAYLVDSYRKQVKQHNMLDYCVFVSFFPQLIAGPIVHHKQMMPQFSNKPQQRINIQNINLGLFIFAMGLFKKVVIADQFAVWASNGFDNLEVISFVGAWVTSLSYTFQLYYDFSGYTDMAIGSALMFNITLPINFNSPYKALNIQDFWRRWHITLSNFLRDYIYVPLGGNRVSEFNVYFNLFITFLLGGLWHGAGWTFIAWGALHGFAVIIHRAWTKLGLRMNRFLAWFITFNFVNIAWVFFRAKEWNDAIMLLKGMMGFQGFYSASHYAEAKQAVEELAYTFDLANEISSESTFAILLFKSQFVLSEIGGDIWTLIWIGVFFLVAIFSKNTIEICGLNQNNISENTKVNRTSLKWNTALMASLAFCLAIIFQNQVSEFLYFNF